MSKHTFKSWIVAAALAVAVVPTWAQSGVVARVFQQPGAGAVARQANEKLTDIVSVKDYGADETGVKDSAPGIQKAIDYAASKGKVVFIPAGVYKIVPSTSVTDESGSGIKAALLMRSNMHIVAERGAVLRMADNVSTDAAPQQMRMFFSNQALQNLSFVGLTVDMNGQNNKMSPNRAALSFNRFTQAAIAFSGTPGGTAARGDNVLIDGCTFKNGPGVSVIVMAQSNTAGVTLGKGWTLVNNTFYNNGFDTDDHSSIFGWATDVFVSNNTFDNPAMMDAAKHTGGQVAYEVHGSRTTFAHNRINNYYQGLWIGVNLTEPVVRDVKLTNNTGRVSLTFSDFYSANLSTGPSSESAIENVTISGNTVEITADAVADAVKACFKIAARKQPAMANISGNLCKNYDTAKNAVLTLIVVGPGQLAKGDQLAIQNNKAAGIMAGLVTYFSGDGSTAATQNLGRVTFAHNDLGALAASPGGLYINTDVILYGSKAGRIEALRVYGLQTDVPFSIDADAGGRATIYGKAVVPVKVTWNSMTALGNGLAKSKVSIDTDAGFATITAQLNIGTTTVFDGSQLFPRFGGLVANADGFLSGMLNNTYAILGRIDNTGSWATLFTSYGVLNKETPFSLGNGMAVTITGQFPTASAQL